MAETALTSSNDGSSSGSDNINGTKLNDVITTGDGNDTVKAGAGNDNVDDGSGNDTITGGDGLGEQERRTAQRLAAGGLGNRHRHHARCQRIGNLLRDRCVIRGRQPDQLHGGTRCAQEKDDALVSWRDRPGRAARGARGRGGED